MTLKYNNYLNCNNISQYYSFYSILDFIINADLVSMRDFYQKLLNGSVYTLYKTKHKFAIVT